MARTGMAGSAPGLRPQTAPDSHRPSFFKARSEPIGMTDVIPTDELSTHGPVQAKAQRGIAIPSPRTQLQQLSDKHGRTLYEQYDCPAPRPSCWFRKKQSISFVLSAMQKGQLFWSRGSSEDAGRTCHKLQGFPLVLASVCFGVPLKSQSLLQAVVAMQHPGFSCFTNTRFG